MRGSVASASSSNPGKVNVETTAASASRSDPGKVKVETSAAATTTKVEPTCHVKIEPTTATKAVKMETTTVDLLSSDSEQEIKVEPKGSVKEEIKHEPSPEETPVFKPVCKRKGRSQAILRPKSAAKRNVGIKVCGDAMLAEPEQCDEEVPGWAFEDHVEGDEEAEQEEAQS